MAGSRSPIYRISRACRHLLSVLRAKSMRTHGVNTGVHRACCSLSSLSPCVSFALFTGGLIIQSDKTEGLRGELWGPVFYNSSSLSPLCTSLIWPEFTVSRSKRTSAHTAHSSRAFLARNLSRAFVIDAGVSGVGVAGMSDDLLVIDTLIRGLPQTRQKGK